MNNQKAKANHQYLRPRIKVARVEAKMNQLELATLLNTDYNLVVDQTVFL
ncbi:MAG: hypothetical protein IPP67_03785 [Rhodospirillaceae bacterium]|nr:hypothetical protein [Rhodospirillaceae bacterium]